MTTVDYVQVIQPIFVWNLWADERGEEAYYEYSDGTRIDCRWSKRKHCWIPVKKLR